jgi:hypothetical protein
MLSEVDAYLAELGKPWDQIRLRGKAGSRLIS